MLFKSPHPDLQIPNSVTTWEWAFENPETSSVARTLPSGRFGGYTDTTTNQRLDFRAVKRLAEFLSTALVQECGLRPEHAVSLFSTNSIWYPIVMWATVRVGGRVNGASPAYSVDEMAHALRTAETAVLVTLPSSLEVAVTAAGKAGIPKSRILLLEGTSVGFTSIQALIRKYETTARIEPSSRLPFGTSNADVCGFLNFSSGTTGLPKAVMLSHANVIAQCHQLRQLQLLPADGHYSILAVMPLFHITGLVRFCTYPVFMNGDCYMMPSYTLDLMLQNIIRFRVEELILVPPILVRLVRDPITNKYLPQLQGIVKRFSSGSAPISTEITQLLCQKFPATGFRQGYGATESTACISSHPGSHMDYRYAHTGGLLVANTVAKVISLTDETKMLGVGETGEICAKGPQIAMGYLNNPEATKESFDEDGFLHTGDVGHIDAEGLIHVEDRIKEMIKVKGQQVAPAELESLILGHKEIEECAVVGIRDEWAGERPKAFVVPRRNKIGDEYMIQLGKEVIDLVKARTVRYKWLVEVEFIDCLPRNPTGKLLRRLLKSRDEQAKTSQVVIVRSDTDVRAKL
ncbi:4-coumarate-CoA ligase [Xylariaceae sp. FL0255]|nr:4-coumarate-CoA ligase [Xylariaceae sp. FL0255]